MGNSTASYDHLVIGGGVGGLYSALVAAEYGLEVGLVEESRLSGTFVNAGCARKKNTWDAASVADAVRESKSYGFSGQELVPFDWGSFKGHNDAFCGESIATLHDLNKVKVKQSDGTSFDITAKNILVAVGSHPKIPDIQGAELGIASDGFFSLTEQPKKAAVVGEGHIAIELAGSLHTLGTETHVFIRAKSVLHSFDPMIQETLLAEYKRRGIHIHDHSSISKVEDLGHGWKRVHSKTKGTGDCLDVDCLLWAVGRVPETKTLNLDKVGVRQNMKGQITVDDEWSSSVGHIYAVGDVCDNDHNLTPVAAAAGTKLSRNLFGGYSSASLKTTTIPSVIFAHPPIGTIGLSESKARDFYGIDNVQSIVHKTTPSYYWAMMGEKDYRPTVYKIVCAGQNRKVVGLHIIGRGVDEQLQGFAVAMRSGAILDDFDDCLAVHPTASEELVTLGKVGERRATGSELDAQKGVKTMLMDGLKS